MNMKQLIFLSQCLAPYFYAAKLFETEQSPSASKHIQLRQDLRMLMLGIESLVHILQ